MRLRALDYIACPLDGTPLELRIWQSEIRPLSDAERARATAMGIDPGKLEQDIQTGVLLNEKRKIIYPIHAGVPRLLAFRTGVADTFLAEHGSRLKRELPGYSLPSEPAMPGEEELLASYSNMWVDYGWNGKAYWNLTAEGTNQAMEYMLDVEHHPVEGKAVLEVGIGIGGFADHLARTRGCELVGIDLSYAADAAHHAFRSNPFFHIVQTSANLPGIRESKFDLVYSHGVILCSFSTKHAFQRIARLAKPGGRTYVWVYGMKNEMRTAERRLLWKAESVLRPVLSRLPTRLQTLGLMPILPLYILRQNVFARGEERNQTGYGFREALHAARDRFTPRFLHRHDEEELADWFRAEGYDELVMGSERSFPDYVPRNFITNSSVTGTRAAR